MRQVVARFVVVSTILASGILPQAVVAAQAQPTQSKKTEQRKKPEGTSLTGCVDQQDGQFVLVDDHDPNKVIADLNAVGFPAEGFAKHVGSKVIVRGISTTGGARPVFKVRSIETVSETCAPQAPQGEKK